MGMPLPDYGHHNAEKKTHQDMVFEMAPEIVSDDDSMEVVNGKKVKRKRGKITTGKLGIDLERTLVIHDEKTPNISPRVSLSSQHHASKTMQVAGGAGYSVARVTETRKRMEIRGLN